MSVLGHHKIKKDVFVDICIICCFKEGYRSLRLSNIALIIRIISGMNN